MTVDDELSLGKVNISASAIAALASQSVLECYGIVGMASKNRWERFIRFLSRDRSRRGVQVCVGDRHIAVDLYVVVEYGTRISEVAQGAMRQVRFTLEKTLGLPIAEVNIHVQGLRVSPDVG